ncbi:MAG: hypothetical protein IPP90_20885 [Gemmatimonadaceae bacterium]|nr:hypothetical protein [Gemmatimonadaceae bacterium]
MRRFVIRFLDAFVRLGLVTSLTFALIHVAPADPATLLVAPTTTADDIAWERARIGPRRVDARAICAMDGRRAAR